MSKFKNKAIAMGENGQDIDPSAELQYLIHTALKSAADHLSNDEMWALCYAANMPYSEYIKEKMK